MTLIEPKSYATGGSVVRAEPNEAYAFLRDSPSGAVATGRGDPRATAEAIFAVVDAEAPPLRLFLGDGPLQTIEAEYARRIELWDLWNDVAVAAESIAEVVS